MRPSQHQGLPRRVVAGPAAAASRAACSITVLTLSRD